MLNVYQLDAPVKVLRVNRNKKEAGRKDELRYIWSLFNSHKNVPSKVYWISKHPPENTFLFNSFFSLGE